MFSRRDKCLKFMASEPVVTNGTFKLDTKLDQTGAKGYAVRFQGKGWACGVLQYENGVLIDSPINESTRDSSHWMMLLHRLGWRRLKGSPLTAHRACWGNNSEVAYKTLDTDWSRYPDQFAKQFGKQFATISKDSFYSDCQESGVN